MIYSDYRAKKHKATHVIFSGDGPVCCTIYSSKQRALRRLLSCSHEPMSLHDTFGRLIAYTDHGNVVIRHAHR